MATFLRSNRSIVLTGVFVTFLFLLQLCNAKVENTSEYEYDPEKTIEENFFSYSQFGLYYFRRIHFFDKYFTIVLFAIGFPGNFISFLVWSSKRMYHGNSAAVYLAALSLNDTVVLAIALFRDLTKIWDVPFYPTPGSCEVLETITLTVQYASPLFVLAFTIERWLAICQPFMVSRICSVQRAVRICIGIIVLTLLVCSPMAYLIGTDPLGCQPRSWAVFHFTTTLEILYSLVTPLLVLTFNCLVINEMSKIRRSQMMKMLPGTKRNSRSGSDMDEVGFFRRLFRKSRERRLESGVPMTVALTKDAYRRKTEIDSGGGDASSPKFKSTTIMLLVVSFYVIIATLLGGLWYVLDIKFTIEAYAKWKKRQVSST
ncbi:unnamed protein product [Mesocestoides corti]|uniref:G_PROTEIN_RECEP_F1_2 domain-containing protein n=1 Tax=Mesocestoides corti TaxID=53468 RepID=A0A0R3UIZ5_MESCO|nr:unnamed protein product [Mesocestoides corti]